MKRILLGLVFVMMVVPSAFCEEQEPDMDKEMKHLELMRNQTGFDFEQQNRKLDLEQRQLELQGLRMKIERSGNHQKNNKGQLFLLCGIVHVLMAVWVYQDVRKRNNGNGIWIAITLLVGFFGAAVYALIRLGDCRRKQEEA
ncbi:MAG: hypothetical protein K9M54_09210 [Kiritimatiellales bacterium]|nr:hypothetical protein [Kiritimatiellales bacterium]MCF7864346.1 hypothetical protein [Kiritimatiellales bacterium]